MKRTLLYGCDVFDGRSTEPARADIVIEGEKIVDVGTDLDGDDAVDCNGQTVLPGLIDCHVHVMMTDTDVIAGLQKPFSLRFYEAIQNLRATLEAGVTIVRDAGGADLGVKQAVDRNLIPGPRMLISIAPLSQTGGHGDSWYPCGTDVPILPAHPGRPSSIVDGPDEMRKKVRELVRMGADVIKVATSGGVISPRSDPRHRHFQDSELAVLQEEAAAANIAVMAHAQATDGIKAAIRHGVRSIEHGIFLDDEAIDMMLAHDVWLVPTLSAPLALRRQLDAGASLSQEVRDKVDLVIEQHSDSVTRAVAAGVRVAFGTDSGVGRHGDNLDELALLAACGLRPHEVLRAATSRAAELLRLSDRSGTIVAGGPADLVVVQGSPFAFENLRSRIVAVYRSGQRFTASRPFSPVAS